MQVSHTHSVSTPPYNCCCDCSDSVRSSLFCAIATTIERCKVESMVDVFQTVKALRVHRPGAVLSVVC